MDDRQGIIVFLAQQKGLRQASLPAGVTVCDQGDRCESLVVLTRGRVKVFRLGEDGRRITLYQS